MLELPSKHDLMSELQETRPNVRTTQLCLLELLNKRRDLMLELLSKHDLMFKC